MPKRKPQRKRPPPTLRATQWKIRCGNQRGERYLESWVELTDEVLIELWTQRGEIIEKASYSDRLGGYFRGFAVQITKWHDSEDAMYFWCKRGLMYSCQWLDQYDGKHIQSFRNISDLLRVIPHDSVSPPPPHEFLSPPPPPHKHVPPPPHEHVPPTPPLRILPLLTPDMINYNDVHKYLKANPNAKLSDMVRHLSDQIRDQGY